MVQIVRKVRGDGKINITVKLKGFFGPIVFDTSAEAEEYCSNFNNVELEGIDTTPSSNSAE